MLSHQYRESNHKSKNDTLQSLFLQWESLYAGTTVFILKRGPRSCISLPFLTPYLDGFMLTFFNNTSPVLNKYSDSPRRPRDGATVFQARYHYVMDVTQHGAMGYHNDRGSTLYKATSYLIERTQIRHGALHLKSFWTPKIICSCTWANNFWCPERLPKIIICLRWPGRYQMMSWMCLQFSHTQLFIWWRPWTSMRCLMEGMAYTPDIYPGTGYVIPQKRVPVLVSPPACRERARNHQAPQRLAIVEGLYPTGAAMLTTAGPSPARTLCDML